MDNLYIEAYKFYKNDYAHGLVLFHIQSHFEAYEDDAIQLGAVLNLPVYLQEGVKFCSFPDYELVFITIEQPKLIRNIRV